MPSGPGTYGNKVGRPPKKYKKGKKVVGTAAPGKPYYSSKKLRKGFEETLPASISSEQHRRGPMCSASPTAVIQDAATHGMAVFRGEEGKRGSRIARKAAKDMVKPKKQTKKKKKKPNKRVDEAAYGVGGDSRLEGAIISPPLDPRGGVDRFPDDIDARRETPVAKSSRGFAPFDKKKKKAKKLYNMGGKVRGAGKATQGVRKCKMVTMKGA